LVSEVSATVHRWCGRGSKYWWICKTVSGRVDPNKLIAYNIPLEKIKMAIERSNRDVGGSVIEMAEREYMVRGLGYIKNIDDIKSIPVGVDKKWDADIN